MTTVAKKPIHELHAEHKEWLNKLSFYEDDMKVMKSRIAEVASKNTSKDTLSMVEHFQNQLVVQKETIDTLRHGINEHETYLLKKADKGPAASDHLQMNDHPKHRDEVQSFEKVFNELRKELIGFLSKVF
jgi:hypothetical protein